MIIYCPKCKFHYVIDDDMIGSEAECERCHYKFVIKELFVVPVDKVSFKKMISTALIVLSIIFLFGGTFASLIIGNEYTTSWGWCIFIASIIISANFVCWGLLLESLDNIESLLSKKK